MPSVGMKHCFDFCRAVLDSHISYCRYFLSCIYWVRNELSVTKWLCGLLYFEKQTDKICSWDWNPLA